MLVETGTQWLGKIPEHWELSKISHCFKHRNETVSDKEFQPLSVTKNGVLPQLETAAKSDNSDGRKLIRKGDFVINQRSDRKGSAGVSPMDGSCSVIYTVLEPLKYEPRYAHHLFRSAAFQEEFYRWGTGIVDDLWSTRYSLMRQIVCPVPPLEEQRAIADFLDAELKQIDQLIEKQTEMIQLMGERRFAMIRGAISYAGQTHSVKKGHLKWFAKFQTGATPSNAEYIDVDRDSMPWLRPDDLDESGRPSIGSRFFSHSELAGFPKAKPGATLLCCIGATLGKAGYVLEECCFNQQITAIEAKMESRFFYYQIVAKRDELKSLSMGNTLAILNNDRLGVLETIFPTVDVQSKVVKELDEKLPKIDLTISSVTRLISLLEERKKALVSSAVTGKIDFRGKN